MGKAAKAESKPSLPEGQKKILGGEIPPYEGAKITKSATQANRSLVEMETNDSPEEVMNFYKTEMTGKGWSVKMAVSRGKIASLSMFKGKRALLLSAGQRSGKTKVTLMFTK